MVSFTPFISRWVECIAKLERVLSPWGIIMIIIIITLGVIKKHITKFPTVSKDSALICRPYSRLGRLSNMSLFYGRTSTNHHLVEN